MSPESFEKTITKLKHVLSIGTDADLCRELGISTSAFANRKKTVSLPYEEILAMAKLRGLNVNYIFGTNDAPTFGELANLQVRKMVAESAGQNQASSESRAAIVKFESDELTSLNESSFKRADTKAKNDL